MEGQKVKQRFLPPHNFNIDRSMSSARLESTIERLPTLPQQAQRIVETHRRYFRLKCESNLGLRFEPGGTEGEDPDQREISIERWFQYLPYEQAQVLDLIRTENLICNKIVTTFAALCCECKFLVHECERKYLPAILFFGEGGKFRRRRRQLASMTEFIVEQDGKEQQQAFMAQFMSLLQVGLPCRQ